MIKREREKEGDRNMTNKITFAFFFICVYELII